MTSSWRELGMCGIRYDLTFEMTKSVGEIEGSLSSKLLSRQVIGANQERARNKDQEQTLRRLSPLENVNTIFATMVKVDVYHKHLNKTMIGPL